MRDRRVDTSALLMGIGALLLAIFFLLAWIQMSGTSLLGDVAIETGSGLDLARVIVCPRPCSKCPLRSAAQFLRS